MNNTNLNRTLLNRFILIFMLLMLGGCVSTGGTQAAAQQQIPATPLTSKADIKSVQESLKFKGFNPGPVDGFMGKKTSDAISRFQQREGYPIDGLATTRLLAQLQPGYKSSQATYNDEIIGQSTATAALTGAVIGATIGALTGDKKSALAGAAIGAAAGAAVDVGVNAYRVDKAKGEHQLNISIDEVRQQNEELRRNISDAKDIIKNDRAKIQQLTNQLKHKKITQAEAQKEFTQLDSNRKLLQTTYDDLLIKQKEMQTYAKAPGATKETIDEINRLNTEVASLRTQLDELDQLRSISLTG